MSVLADKSSKQTANITATPKPTQGTEASSEISLIEGGAVPGLYKSPARGDDEAPQPSALQRWATTLNATPPARRAAVLLKVQRTQGNQFAGKVLRQAQQTASSANRIQRDEPAATTTAPPAAVVWTPPLDLAAASTREDAVNRLLDIASQMDGLKEAMGDLDTSGFEPSSKAVRMLLNTLSSEGAGALSGDDVAQLNIGCSGVASAISSGRTALNGVISKALQSLFSADTGDMDNVQANLDEEMRKAFLAGSDPSHITQIKSAMGAIKQYKDYADKVAGWATNANSLLNSAKLKDYLEAFGKQSKKLGEGLKYVGQLLDAAKIISNLTTDQGPGESANDIAKFEATISAIDLAMGFAKAVPPIGQLWSSYYKPLTDACIKQMKIIFRLVDEKKRELTLLDWMTDAGTGRGPNNTPIIPPLHLSAFPGGQAVLNYMYPLVNGNAPVMTPEIEKFFIEHKSLFNAGANAGDEIKSEWHIFGPSTSPNLVGWIARNQNIAWAMLYGDMQKNI